VTAYRIERAAPGEAERLREIEQAAGRRFRAVGMADIADHESTDAEVLDDHAQCGRLYIARDRTGLAVGFLIWSPKDGCAYIEEVVVHTDHAGHRLAGRMIDRLAEDVRGRCPALTLATFREVAWNGPYYAKLGFTEISHHDLGTSHEQSWRDQADHGLDMSRRIFMTRLVPA
jgi:GNAT superfamily N-acetyltransferase